MKNIILSLTIILFFIIIVSGHLHWKSEINHNAKKAEAQVETLDSDTAQDNNNGVQEKTTPTKETKQSTNIDFDALTKLLPQAVQEKILQAEKQHKQVSVVLSGGNEISGLGVLLQKKLNDAYGQNFFKVTETSFQNQNSLTVYQNQLYTKLVDAKPDIVIFTSMLINDNGKVSSHDSARVPVLIGDRIQEIAPNTVFMIEPPNPVTYNEAINQRAEEVKSEADNADFEYIDHLSAWQADSGLDADLDAQGMYPNAQGLKIWSDYLAGYFTSSN